MLDGQLGCSIHWTTPVARKYLRGSQRESLGGGAAAHSLSLSLDSLVPAVALYERAVALDNSRSGFARVVGQGHGGAVSASQIKTRNAQCLRA